MGKRSRDKGKRGEREASVKIARLFGVSARRGCQYSGSPDSPDILAAVPGVHWEVKRSERLRLYEAVEQAMDDAGSAIPAVLYRANRRPWLAIVQLDDLPLLARRLADVCPDPEEHKDGNSTTAIVP